MRCFVYFWDGYVVGPRIETVTDDLPKRLGRVLGEDADPFPPRVSARFIAFDLAEDKDVMAWSAPPARTTSQLVSTLESQDYWPSTAADQGGVFLVHTGTGEIRVNGGLGFAESADDTNVRALRHYAVNTAGELV